MYAIELDYKRLRREIHQVYLQHVYIDKITKFHVCKECKESHMDHMHIEHQPYCDGWTLMRLVSDLGGLQVGKYIVRGKSD